MSSNIPDPELGRLTARIVVAYISRTPVPTVELFGVIRSVFAALNNVEATAPPADAQLKPAVPLKKSVFPDYIVCLEDEDAQEASADQVWHDPRRVPGTLGVAGQLPDDGPALFGPTVRPGQEAA